MPIQHNREHAALQYKPRNSPATDQPWGMNFPRTKGHHNPNHLCSRGKPVSSPVCSNTLKILCPFTRYSNVYIQADTILITSHITTYFCSFSAPSLAVSSLLEGLVWGTKPFKKINSLSCCSVLSAGLAPWGSSPQGQVSASTKDH